MVDTKSLKTLLATILQRHATADAFDWLAQKATAIEQEEDKAAQLNAAFAAVPRKTGNAGLVLQEDEIQALQEVLQMETWTLDRLGRVWLLLHVDSQNKESYIQKIETLFSVAAMNELVALYSALPVLQYPEAWRSRCAEGIRSNIGGVLEAIMCNNGYPAQQLDEKAWNQMVLKAFFTEKPVHRIVGLDARRNKELAYILSDYAHERWAAGREVPPQLWRCVAPFVDQTLFQDIVQLARKTEADKEAAVLVCRESTYAACKQLLREPHLQAFAANSNLSWQALAENTVTTV